MITSLNCIRFLLICFLSRFLLVCLFVIFCYCCRCFVIFLVLFNWSTRFFFWSTWFWRINWWLIRINWSFILFKNSCYCVVISYSVWEWNWCCICIKVVDFFAGFVCYFPAFECISFICYYCRKESKVVFCFLKVFVMKFCCSFVSFEWSCYWIDYNCCICYCYFFFILFKNSCSWKEWRRSSSSKCNSCNRFSSRIIRRIRRSNRTS